MSPPVWELLHQQNTFLWGRNGCVRVDALCQSRQRHPGGRILRVRPRYHVSHCRSPSDRRFFSLCRSTIGDKHSAGVANCDHTSEWVHWVHTSIGIAIQRLTLRKSLLRIPLHYVRVAYEEGEKIRYYPAVRIHKISVRASETKSWKR
jgi:hypothetical protein